MNYEQIEQKIIAEFMANHPDLKESQIKEELKSAGIDNRYKEAKTAREKANIVYDGVRTLFYAIGKVVGLTSLGSLGSLGI